MLAGVAGAAALGRTLESLLFGVSAFDPATYVTASVMLVLVGLAAAAVPAIRASRIDPVRALRQE
ncbi:MAG: hypothetical protein EPO35_09940 [Acidobacteria bacterium]|nr:MAG: hypothetical protein EPO35_09940 [Acidobacteriota bacterium]